ncbi:MAG: tol-pal system YbgF family protein [Sandaracinaceae bacterium]
MKRSLRGFAVVVALALALGTLVESPSHASAQEANASEEEARHHFRIGQAHYESGHFREAATEFAESYRLSHRPALLHNLYVAYRDAGMVSEAADALRRYLAESPEVENRPLLERRLANLEAMAANQSNDGGSGAHDDPDHDAGSDASSDAGDSHATSRGDRSSSDASGGGGFNPSPVGFIVAGIGAAALIGAAVTGPLALTTESDLASMCPNDACPPGVDVEGRAGTGRALAITTDVLLGVGVAALATGVILIFVLQEGGDEAPVAAACGPDGCMAIAHGSF